MSYKLFLFDMDGTLADTDLAIVQTFVDLYNKYNPTGRPSLNDLVTFSGPPIRESLFKCFPNDNQEALFNDFVDISVKYYHKYLVLYPYALEVLQKAKSEGYKISIVTGKRGDVCRECLDVLGISNIIENVISPTEVKNPKPDPEGILKAIEFYPGIKKDEVLYIGDNANDFLAAKNAGVDSMIVTWGPRKMDKIIKPTYFLDSYKDFFEVIKNGKN